jgi:hypothetical protein
MINPPGCAAAEGACPHIGDTEPNCACGLAERWAPIEGFRGYEVSDRGRVRSYLTSMGLRRVPRLIATPPDKQGRPSVLLTTKFSRVSRTVSELKAAAFGEQT